MFSEAGNMPLRFAIRNEIVVESNRKNFAPQICGPCALSSLILIDTTSKPLHINQTFFEHNVGAEQ